MKNKKFDSFQDKYNPLHFYAELRSIGLEKEFSRRYAEIYEIGIYKNIIEEYFKKLEDRNI